MQNSQSIATYRINTNSSNNHCVKLYSDGTTLEVIDRNVDEHDTRRRDKWDRGGGQGDYTFDTHREEIAGTYRNSSYRKQLKELVIQNHRSGKLKELPTWL